MGDFIGEVVLELARGVGLGLFSWSSSQTCPICACPACTPHLHCDCSGFGPATSTVGYQGPSAFFTLLISGLGVIIGYLLRSARIVERPPIVVVIP